MKFTEEELKRGYYIAENGMGVPTSPVANCIFCSEPMTSSHNDRLCVQNQINAELIAARNVVELLRKMIAPRKSSGHKMIPVPWRPDEDDAARALAEYDRVTKRI